jgi:hypothetical protein
MIRQRGYPAHIVRIPVDTNIVRGYSARMNTTWIIRLRQISTGHEADSMLFRGTEAAARAHAAQTLAGHADLELASIRAR